MWRKTTRVTIVDRRGKMEETFLKWTNGEAGARVKKNRESKKERERRLKEKDVQKYSDLKRDRERGKGRELPS